MKKLLLLLGAVLLFTACPRPNQESNTGVTVKRTNIFSGSLMGEKTSWSKGDVIFVFFKGIPAPKYLELKYSGKVWMATEKNGLTADELIGAPEKKMTAVFLPYGNNSKVAADGDSFVFQGEPYRSWFLQAENADYTYDDGKLMGTLDMKAPGFDVPGGMPVLVDLFGHVSGREYLLYNDRMRGVSFGSVTADGKVLHQEGEMNVGIHGTPKSSRMIFFGVLDGSVVGQERDYQFSLQDREANVLYTCDAGVNLLKAAHRFELGDINLEDQWTRTEYVDLNLTNKAGERLYWAKKNLGATVEKGEGSFGDYFFWSATDGHALAGTFGSYTVDFKFNVFPEFRTDENGILKPEYDAAHWALSGLWRMPTVEEFGVLRDGTVHSPYSNHKSIENGLTYYRKDTKTVSLFLPAAGRVDTDTLKEEGATGYYWSSSGAGSVRGGYLTFTYDGYAFAFVPDAFQANNNQALPVRPVFSVRY